MSSFRTGPSVESQNGTAEDFDVLSSVVTNGLYGLNANIKSIHRLLGKLGTSRATADDQHRLGALVEETTDKFKLFGDEIKVLTEWDSSKLQPTQRFTQRNLWKEFQGIVDEFRALQRDVVAKEREIRFQAIVQQEAEQINENTPLMQRQQQQQQQSQILDVVAQDEVDFHASLLQEREVEIQNIEQGISEINAIFKDLGTLVTEQGTQIDAVEENISNLATNTERASKQLTKADQYQRSRRKWSCCVLMVLIVVVLVVTLAVLS
jgi:t-SNARE complex subunit (syntaxin)